MATIVRAGRTVETIPITALADGRPLPVGRIQVRTGDVVRTSEPPDITNAIGFAYSGGRMGSTHWIQFLWAEVTYTLSGGLVHAQGSIRMTGSPVRVPLTVATDAPTWILDSAARDPFYESGALSLSTPAMNTVWDQPGGPSAVSIADTIWRAQAAASDIRFIAHAEMFLIQGDRAVFAIGWSATTDVARTSGSATAGPVQYAVVSRRPVSGLPAAFRSMIGTRYPGFRAIQ